jgi:hypothetical protein
MQFNLVGVASRKRIVPKIYPKPHPHKELNTDELAQFEIETFNNVSR